MSSDPTSALDWTPPSSPTVRLFALARLRDMAPPRNSSLALRRSFSSLGPRKAATPPTLVLEDPLVPRNDVVELMEEDMQLARSAVGKWVAPSPVSTAFTRNLPSLQRRPSQKDKSSLSPNKASSSSLSEDTSSGPTTPPTNRRASLALSRDSTVSSSSSVSVKSKGSAKSDAASSSLGPTTPSPSRSPSPRSFISDPVPPPHSSPAPPAPEASRKSVESALRTIQPMVTATVTAEGKTLRHTKSAGALSMRLPRGAFFKKKSEKKSVPPMPGTDGAADGLVVDTTSLAPRTKVRPPMLILTPPPARGALGSPTAEKTPSEPASRATTPSTASTTTPRGEAQDQVKSTTTPSMPPTTPRQKSPSSSSLRRASALPPPELPPPSTPLPQTPAESVPPTPTTDSSGSLKTALATAAQLAAQLETPPRSPSSAPAPAPAPAPNATPPLRALRLLQFLQHDSEEEHGAQTNASSSSATATSLADKSAPPADMCSRETATTVPSEAPSIPTPRALLFRRSQTTVPGSSSQGAAAPSPPPKTLSPRLSMQLQRNGLTPISSWKYATATTISTTPRRAASGSEDTPPRREGILAEIGITPPTPTDAVPPVAAPVLGSASAPPSVPATATSSPHLSPSSPHLSSSSCDPSTLTSCDLNSSIPTPGSPSSILLMRASFSAPELALADHENLLQDWPTHSADFFVTGVDGDASINVGSGDASGSVSVGESVDKVGAAQRGGGGEGEEGVRSTSTDPGSGSGSASQGGDANFMFMTVSSNGPDGTVDSYTRSSMGDQHPQPATMTMVTGLVCGATITYNDGRTQEEGQESAPEAWPSTDDSPVGGVGMGIGPFPRSQSGRILTKRAQSPEPEPDPLSPVFRMVSSFGSQDEKKRKEEVAEPAPATPTKEMMPTGMVSSASTRSLPSTPTAAAAPKKHPFAVAPPRSPTKPTALATAATTPQPSPWQSTTATPTKPTSAPPPRPEPILVPLPAATPPLTIKGKTLPSPSVHKAKSVGSLVRKWEAKQQSQQQLQQLQQQTQAKLEKEEELSEETQHARLAKKVVGKAKPTTLAQPRSKVVATPSSPGMGVVGWLG